MHTAFVSPLLHTHPLRHSHPFQQVTSTSPPRPTHSIHRVAPVAIKRRDGSFPGVSFRTRIEPSQSQTFQPSSSSILRAVSNQYRLLLPCALTYFFGIILKRPDAKTYNVTFRNPKEGTVSTFKVPEDRYIWHAINDQGADLPSSCRNGCCTTCAVKLSKGSVDQREALGLLKELRQEGYALLCVSYPTSDIDCTLQDEDEVYVKQFGSSFESGGVEWGGVMPEDD